LGDAMMANESKEIREIEESKVILVEGKDDLEFIREFLKFEGISGVRIEEVKGTGNFEEYVGYFVKKTGFRSNVKIFAVIRDADESETKAFESVKRILESDEVNIPVPEKNMEFFKGEKTVGIFVMPGSGESGMLEDLCLKSVEGHPNMECVDEFIKCIEEKDNKKLNQPAKRKALAFLCSMPKILRGVGLGAQERYWNLGSEVFDKLRTFLRNFM
jgi:hypothetical protein